MLSKVAKLELQAAIELLRRALKDDSGEGHFIKFIERAEDAIERAKQS